MSKENASGTGISAIAHAYRRELEDYLGYEGNPATMVGQCMTASKELAARLKSHGFAASAVRTLYLNVGEHYPNLVREQMVQQELESDDLEEFDGSWTHWVVRCSDLLVDVTQDQFHPPGEAEGVVVLCAEDPEWADYFTTAGRNSSKRAAFLR